MPQSKELYLENALDHFPSCQNVYERNHPVVAVVRTSSYLNVDALHDQEEEVVVVHQDSHRKQTPSFRIDHLKTHAACRCWLVDPNNRVAVEGRCLCDEVGPYPNFHGYYFCRQDMLLVPPAARKMCRVVCSEKDPAKKSRPTTPLDQLLCIPYQGCDHVLKLLSSLGLRPLSLSLQQTVSFLFHLPFPQSRQCRLLVVFE
mmetsp:Transcript_35391/g.101957  ORF Transcript_35391/g.101957 Transcript_35391/m.101957 type:complete len:201 (+) Transcript_35391:3470-4072(+)